MRLAPETASREEIPAGKIYDLLSVPLSVSILNEDRLRALMEAAWKIDCDHVAAAVKPELKAYLEHKPVLFGETVK